MNAGTCWEQEYNRPNGLSVEKAPKSDLYLFTFMTSNKIRKTIDKLTNRLNFFLVHKNCASHIISNRCAEQVHVMWISSLYRITSDEKYQLDATILYIIINNSTCFGHLYAHLQEYTGCILLLIVFSWTPYAVVYNLYTPEDGHIDARNM